MTYEAVIALSIVPDTAKAYDAVIALEALIAHEAVIALEALKAYDALNAGLVLVNIDPVTYDAVSAFVIFPDTANA